MSKFTKKDYAILDLYQVLRLAHDFNELEGYSKQAAMEALKKHGDIANKALMRNLGR